MFSELDARRVVKADSRVANYIVGSGIDSAKDCCGRTTSFVQPTGIWAEGETIFLTDTGAECKHASCCKNFASTSK